MSGQVNKSGSAKTVKLRRNEVYIVGFVPSLLIYPYVSSGFI